MFVHLAIHRPRPDKTAPLIDSMHRFGAALIGQAGLQQVHTLKDQKTGNLIGLAMWDSKAAWLAARPAMAEAIQGDNFEDWEDEPPEVYHLEAV
ncbi:MAG TPA: hypothetical protein VJG32_20705 [Anaerolineae bacterium]|nr:hypothetical protein [Anaerolineae bacterium]